MCEVVGVRDLARQILFYLWPLVQQGILIETNKTGAKLSMLYGRPVNPHLDHNRVVWSDEYSGQYKAVEYGEQFDDQWRFFLGKKTGFVQHTGVETSDPYIDDRILELTGVKGFLARQKLGMLYPIKAFLEKSFNATERRKVGGQLFLEPKFPIDFFEGKTCLDIGCGAGRWTRTLLALGGTVKSIDVSKHGLESTRRFNRNVEELNLFEIKASRPDLHSVFDFCLCWGVIMCTHDPKLAFENICQTVRPGGYLYSMVYAPTYHNSDFVLTHRRYYHTKLTTLEEKLEYAYAIADRLENAINVFDMLNTFYNWTIPKEVILGWYVNQGFEEIIVLNKEEENKCAYHILGKKL